MRIFSAQSIRAGFMAAVIAVSSFGVGLYSTRSASAQVFNNGGTSCSVSLPAPKANAFTVSGNMATTSVQVNGPANCRETVSLSSWNAPIGSTNFRPFENQQFVTGKTISNLGPGMHTLSIAVNNSCSFQADILLGSNQKTAAGNANFGNDLMGFTQVDAGVCKAPTPAPTPSATPAPTPASASCSGNATTSANTGTSQGNCNTSTTNTTIVQQQQNQNQTPQTTTPQTTPAQQESAPQTQQQQASTPQASASQMQSQQQQAPSSSTPAAQFTCDALMLTQDNTNNSVTISDFHNTVANGATFTGADIDWGDGTTAPGVTSVIGQTHQFSMNTGTASAMFTISAVAHFDVNGQDLTAGGPNCQKQVTFAATPSTPTPTPTTITPTPTTTSTPTQVATTTPATTAPTQLVNTGPGNLIGIFGISTILGTLGYRFFLRYLLGRM